MALLSIDRDKCKRDGLCAADCPMGIIRPIEQEVLQRLIETARYAPTASNAQPLAWRVINGPQRVQTIAGEVIGWMRGQVAAPKATVIPYMPLLVQGWQAGTDIILRSTPRLVAAMAPSEARYGMVDLTPALCYLELIAPLYGLGTCWAGLPQGALMSIPGLKEQIGIPAESPFHYPMMIGYAKTRYYRLPQRKAPRIECGVRNMGAP